MLRQIIIIIITFILSASNFYAQSPITFQQQISSSSNDAEEKFDGSYVTTTSSDIEMMYDSWNSQGLQKIGLRFDNITIPSNATISNAYIQFTADGNSSGSMSMTIEGEDVANSLAFLSGTSNISNRATTSSNVAWSSIPSWVDGASGINQKTPDLSLLVSEIMTSNGWQSGNPITFIINGTGSSAALRKAYSFDGNSSKSAELIIEYTSNSKPGGVSDNLELWLKANVGVLNTATSILATDGQQANTWQDQSGSRTNNATDALLAPPTFKDNSSDYINYNTVVDFDGTNDGLDFGNDYIFSSGSGSENGMTWFAIVEPDLASVHKFSQFVFDLGDAGNRNYSHVYGSENSFTEASIAFGGVRIGNSHSRSTQVTLTRVKIDFGNQISLYLDGGAFLSSAITLTNLSAAEINENPTHISNSGPFTIGCQSKTFNLMSNQGRRLNGSIAELVGFNKVLPANKVRRVESYLAIKYGITLNNSDGATAGDYKSSSGSLIWDASNNSTFHNDVIGIGRDNNSDLIQKQSHQLDDSTRIYLSTLNASNSGNIGGFSTDNQFVLIGQNKEKLASLGSIEYPSGLSIFNRIEREWKVTNTNFNGTFSLDIKLNTSPIDPSHLRVLVDSDDDFRNATMISPTITYSGGVITISGLTTTEIPINTTRYFTIVSLNSLTPLPIKLINFTAMPVNNDYVKLDWQTVSEINNDYFTIERSIKGIDWQEISRVNGAGNSVAFLSYSATDHKPYLGISYYRLKQIDFDGQFEYSQIRSVNIRKLDNSQTEIYPNPANNQITLISNENELQTVRIYNILGQDVTSLILTVVKNETKLLIDLSQLNTGTYYIKTKTTAYKVYKQ